MKFLFLLVLLFLPACGGENAMLHKAFLLALGCVWWCRRVTRGAMSGIPVLGVAVLLVALWATATSPVTTWFEGFVGSPSRVDGWLTLLCVFVFGWLCFWEPPQYDSNGEEIPFDRQFIWFAWLLMAFVGGVMVLRWTSGWEGVAESVARPFGIGTYMAMTAPFVMAYGLRASTMRRSAWIVVACIATIICAILISGGSAVRSSTLGLFIGCAIVCGLSFEPRRVKLMAAVMAGLIFLVAAAIMVHPYTRDRVAAIELSQIGVGPRATLVSQAWQHGTYPLGWGIDSQRHLIDRTLNDGMQFGMYDRFHVWPVDVVMTVGWVGFGLCGFVLVGLAMLAWSHREDWWVCGFAGMLGVFFTYCSFNPPTFPLMLLATLAAAGIWLSVRVTRGFDAPACVLDQRQEWWVGAVLRGTTAIAACVFGVMVLGDQLAFRAKEEWKYNEKLPHELLGQIAFAEKLNPWMRKDRVRLYYFAYKYKAMIEPDGGKKMLLALLRQPRRDYGLESLMWVGLEDYPAAEKAIIEACVGRNIR